MHSSNKRLVARRRYLFLDGYNVIHALGRYKGLSDASLESARYGLIDDLVDYRAFTGEVVTVVFDAYTTKGRKTKIELFKGVNVVYTREHQTADSFIEAEAEKLSQDPKNLVRVVTSDWAEQQVVLGSGAVRLTPREYEYELERVKQAIKDKLPENTRVGDSIESQLSNETKALMDAMRKGKSS